jgi:hypothetical protein
MCLTSHQSVDPVTTIVQLEYSTTAPKFITALNSGAFRRPVGRSYIFSDLA